MVKSLVKQLEDNVSYCARLVARDKMKEGRLEDTCLTSGPDVVYSTTFPLNILGCRRAQG